MEPSKESTAEGYETFYREFDSPLMRQLRREAYGEDIGQHSWVGAEELREYIRRLGLLPSSRFLDLGCGPCGPLTFVLATIGCRGTGVELSPSAPESGRRVLLRSASMPCSRFERPISTSRFRSSLARSTRRCRWTWYSIFATAWSSSARSRDCCRWGEGSCSRMPAS